MLLSPFNSVHVLESNHHVSQPYDRREHTPVLYIYILREIDVDREAQMLHILHEVVEDEVTLTFMSVVWSPSVWKWE